VMGHPMGTRTRASGGSARVAGLGNP
jgi:hypothetical protein